MLPAPLLKELFNETKHNQDSHAHFLKSLYYEKFIRLSKDVSATRIAIVNAVQFGSVLLHLLLLFHDSWCEVKTLVFLFLMISVQNALIC